MPAATFSNVSPTSGSLPQALQTQFDGIVDLLIVETVFPTLLIPIAVCLFMFTRPEIQRKPVFILNVLSIMFGLVFGGIAVAIVVSLHYTFNVNWWLIMRLVVPLRIRAPRQPEVHHGSYRALLPDPSMRPVHSLCEDLHCLSTAGDLPTSRPLNLRHTLRFDNSTGVQHRYRSQEYQRRCPSLSEPLGRYDFRATCPLCDCGAVHGVGL